MVIISHGDFTGNLAPLVAQRESHGRKVAVVNVEDLYDEYNFGAKDPAAHPALLVAGTNKDSGDTFDTYTSAVQGLLPKGMKVTKILQGSDPNAAADFLTAFNSGQGLVNYTGHGSVEVW